MKSFVLIGLWTLLIVLAAAQNPDEEKQFDEEDEEDYTEPPPPDGPPLVPMCELVGSYGYKCEEHQITTKDGYILKLYHIPRSTEPAGPLVLLVHGLMSSGEVWAMKNISAAYQLSDQGNDVWIINLRGSVHSRKHVTLNPDTDEQFWDYSWQEMALHDIPATIAYIKENTKTKQMYYIGHSMGSTIFFTMVSSDPEVAKSIKEAVLLAPVFYATKYQFLLKEGSSMADMYHETMDGFKEKQLWEAFPRSDTPHTEHQIGCDQLPDMAIAYCNIGLDMAKPLVGDFLPAGTSRKNLEHYAQAYAFGKIRFYDYGNEEDNKKIYSSPTPTDIDPKKSSMPTHLFYCESDHILAPEDVETLKKELPNLQTDYFIQEEAFNHVDFLFPMSEETEKEFGEFLTKLKEIVKS